MGDLNQLEPLNASAHLEKLEEGSSVRVLQRQLEQNPVEQLRKLAQNWDAERLLRASEQLKTNVTEAVSVLYAPYLGLVHLGQKLATNINQLLEPFQRIEKALRSIPPEQLDAFSTWLSRFNEDFWRRLDELEQESFALFGRLGLTGLEHCLTSRDFLVILRIQAEEGDEAALSYILAKLSEQEYRRLDDLVEDWSHVPYMAARQKIITSAIAAHKRGEYELSIAALLPLVDGLASEIASTRPQLKPRTISVNDVAKIYSELEPEIASECFVRVVDTLIFRHVDLKRMQPVPSTNNRHGILHGRVADYGTELNSYQVILLLHMTVNVYNRLVPLTTVAVGVP